MILGEMLKSRLRPYVGIGASTAAHQCRLICMEIECGIRATSQQCVMGDVCHVAALRPLISVPLVIPHLTQNPRD